MESVAASVNKRPGWIEPATFLAADPVGVIDSIATDVFKAFVHDATDAVEVTDTLSTVGSVFRGADDQVGISDSHILSLAGDVIVSFTDPVGITDELAAAVAFQRVITDPVGITDALAVAAAFERAATDPVGITDTLAITAAVERSVTDAVGVADAADFVKLMPTGATDPLGITDDAIFDFVPLVLVPFTDTFTRADTADGQLNNGWTVHNGGFVITSGVAANVTIGTPANATRDIGTINQSVSVELSTLDDEAGYALILRANSSYSTVASLVWMGTAWIWAADDGAGGGFPAELLSSDSPSTMIGLGYTHVRFCCYGDGFWWEAFNGTTWVDGGQYVWATDGFASTNTRAGFEVDRGPGSGGVTVITLDATTGLPAGMPPEPIDGGNASTVFTDIIDGGAANTTFTDIIDGDY